MKKKKKFGGLSKIVVAVLFSVLLLSSVLSVFLNKKIPTKTINVYMRYTILGQHYNATQESAEANSSLYNFLSQFAGISFEQDGSMKCIGSYCGSFLNNLAWTIFLNNYPNPDMNTILQEDDYVSLNYGAPMSFGNVTIGFNINNISNSNEVMIQIGMTINDILDNYEAVIENGTLTCIMDMCGNWTTKLNNESIIDYDVELSKYDELIFNYN